MYQCLHIKTTNIPFQQNFGLRSKCQPADMAHYPLFLWTVTKSNTVTEKIKHVSLLNLLWESNWTIGEIISSIGSIVCLQRSNLLNSHNLSLCNLNFIQRPNKTEIPVNGWSCCCYSKGEKALDPSDSLMLLTGIRMLSEIVVCWLLFFTCTFSLYVLLQINGKETAFELFSLGARIYSQNSCGWTNKPS